MKRIDDLLREATEAGASDIHIAPKRPPFFRINGTLKPIVEQALTVAEVQSMIEALLGDNDQAQEKLSKNLQTDLSFAIDEGTRFRVNIFKRQGQLAAALRLIPIEIRSIEQLNMPPQILQFAEQKQGFIIASGPTGEGKSTTLAALVDHINQYRREHIVTVEDPIEYIFQDKKSIIDQREIGYDAISYPKAIRALLRQDPDVILIGEMRDRVSMQTAITLAETGHLVFTTLHTNNAAQTVERIIDSFPGDQQAQVRSQLSNALSGVISQRLLRAKDGGRIPAVEIMITSTAIRNAVREGNVHQIPGMIQTSAELGMQTLDASIQALVDSDTITREEAQPYMSETAIGPQEPGANK